MESFGCMLAVRTPEASLTTRIPHPEFLPSPLGDKVGYFHHDRFRGYLAVHCCSGPFTAVPACNLPVYASQWPLPAITQDLVRGCELGFAAVSISGN